MDPPPPISDYVILELPPKMSYEAKQGSELIGHVYLALCSVAAFKCNKNDLYVQPFIRPYQARRGGESTTPPGFLFVKKNAWIF